MEKKIKIDESIEQAKKDWALVLTLCKEQGVALAYPPYYLAEYYDKATAIMLRNIKDQPELSRPLSYFNSL